MGQRGTRPRAPRDQRTEWAYIFGAICPAKGKGAGLVMPWCDTDAMAAHLIEISAAVDPGAHAVLIVDQAGWHLTPKLAIPDNITVLALPPRSPELNPVETRPRAPRDQRTEWAYIFGAICPAKGKGAGLVMPWCDTDAMAAHLIEISAAVDPGAHAVLIVDQAGWHLTPKLAIPDNITVLALPPRSPELNPVENVWQFMRDNWLSNRIFKSYEDIVALCCQAWNNLIDQPWKIMSLGMRKWAHGF